MTASVQAADDLWFWSRESGLEIVLLMSGAVIVIRAVHSFLAVGSEGWGRDPDARSIDLDLRPQQSVVQALSWLVTALVSIAVGVMVLDRFGVPLATLVPSATVAGVAVGFGAQRVVQDLVSGFFLLAEHQLRIGDVVTISPPGSEAGVSGTVEEMTLRVTRLRTLKGEVVFIPNGEIRQVINLSVEWARIVVDVPLRPDSDVNVVIKVLEQVGEDMSNTEPWQQMLLDGPDVLGVQSLEVGVVQLRVVARVTAAGQWDAGRELRRRITRGLADAGIEPISPLLMPGRPEQP